ncbi:protein jagunal-like isoform X1 [Saccostrea echinata]|uniref:protein jagunal-like isoform X1 n=1 Tax=Saccostrea echinata TaxID=191078 RepID=UPI002A7F6D0F|nr:protein jagunal-like isoform X1 [Saccostrea echinata]
MASKYGPRPVGTDGSDHWHRESVAWQYKFSSLNKSRLRTDLITHIVLSLLMFVRVLPGLTSFLGIGPVSSLRKWNFPPPRPWEYAWMVCTMAILVGWRSMAKNDIKLLKQYVVGSILFGLLPVIFGLIEQSDDLYAYLNEKKYTGQFFGYPAVLVFYLFLFIAIQVHGFGIYFSYQLLKSWKPRERKTQ